MSAMSNANAPHNQPFNVGARPCKSKRNSWWNKASSNYFANRTKKAQKKSAFVDAKD